MTLISILIPFRNEIESVSNYHNTLFPIVDEIMKACNQEYEYVFIDDGSTDDSYNSIIDSFDKYNPKSEYLKLFNLGQNFQTHGLGNALRYGFEKCIGDYIIVMDADLSYKPTDILRMLKVLKENPDVKCISASPYYYGFGSEIVGSSPMRIIGSVTFNSIYSLLLNQELTCATGMFRLYHRETLNRFNLKSTGYDINSEIIMWFLLEKERFIEIPSVLYLRTVGKSKMNIAIEVIREVKLIFKIIWEKWI